MPIRKNKVPLAKTYNADFSESTFSGKIEDLFVYLSHQSAIIKIITRRKDNVDQSQYTHRFLIWPATLAQESTIVNTQNQRSGFRDIKPSNLLNKLANDSYREEPMGKYFSASKTYPIKAFPAIVK